MTALANARMEADERWKYRQFPLAVGNKGYKNGIAVGDLSTGKVEPGHDETDLFVVGKFAETVDATAAEKLVNVDLGKEIEITWWANAGGGDAVVAGDLFNLCYVMDDQTVTRTSTGRSVAGRVWAVDAVRGVAVERLQAVPTPSTSLLGLEGDPQTAGAFVANDLVVPNDPNSGTIYALQATAAASTVTLPATSIDGTIIYFIADGTVNGHTVQYRDATGPVNLTTALTASKRHLVVCVRKGASGAGGKWYCNAYIAP